LPNDPLIASQWYLQNTGQRGAPGIDINLAPIAGRWTGKGIVVAVIDDGMDLSHPDLQANILQNLVYDAERDTTGQGFVATAPRSHGTVVGSIVAMVANNGIGGAGIAYDAKLVPCYFVGANANGAAGVFLANLAAGAHISVNSWGSDPAFSENFSAGGSAADRAWGDAIARCATEARGGLGMVIEVSGGNERGTRADVGLTNFTGNKYTIAVGAVTHEGKVTDYSSTGAGLLITAPGGVTSNADSSVDSGFGIASADISGDGGYNTKTGAAGDYAFQSQGTSYSGPMVAAVAALMLEANPGLGFRDVSMILAMTARLTDPAAQGNGAWVQQAGSEWNLGGMHYSTDYGYGLLDAAAAVRLAESWAGGVNTVANWQSAQGVSTTPAADIGDNTGQFFNVTADVADNLVIERLELDLDITMAAPSQLGALLISPSGTRHFLFETPLTTPQTAWPGTFTIGIAAYLGEPSQGTWTLRLLDVVAGEVATFNSLTVRAWGRPVQPDNQYVFTDEFSGVKALTDDDGTDILNAAALSKSVTILLDRSGDTTIGAGTITIDAGTVIENATGGAANDLLSGNEVANSLRGNDGNDLLTGRGGADRLIGGLGVDAFRFLADTDSPLAGHDVINDLGAFDLIEFSGIAGCTLSPGAFAWAGAVATTVDAIKAAVGLANQLVFFSDGTDGFLYVNGTGTGASFDGSLVELKGRSVAPAAHQIVGQVLAGSTRSGDAAPNALLGGLGFDALNGQLGNDFFFGLGGNDALDGGEGRDIAWYLFTRNADQVTRGASAITVTGPEGTDTLTAVERALFADGALAFDIEGNAGQTYRLYQAAFARQPDVSGLSFWIGQMDAGASLPTVAAQFIGSAEFISQYGANPSNADFVTLLYQNVLNRLPDAGGLAFWVNQLNAGTITRPEVLIGFSESVENKANVLPAISNGIAYNAAAFPGTGTAGNDQLVGTANADNFSALAGRDLLIGLGGNDQLNGGADLDTAGYVGLRGSYTVVYNAATGGITVMDTNGTEGIDALAEIERLQFADKNLAFDIAGNAGQTYRLYQAAFARTPDTPGLSFWIGQMDIGAALLGVAGQFIASAEFTTKYGANPSNGNFVTLLYQNVLNRLPDAGGLAFWVNQLDGGTISRPEVLIGFSESTENQMALIGVLQQGIEYLPLG